MRLSFHAGPLIWMCCMKKLADYFVLWKLERVSNFFHLPIFYLTMCVCWFNSATITERLNSCTIKIVQCAPRLKNLQGNQHLKYFISCQRANYIALWSADAKLYVLFIHCELRHVSGTWLIFYVLHIFLNCVGTLILDTYIKFFVCLNEFCHPSNYHESLWFSFGE